MVEGAPRPAHEIASQGAPDAPGGIGTPAKELIYSSVATQLCVCRTSPRHSTEALDEQEALRPPADHFPHRMRKHEPAPSDPADAGRWLTGARLGPPRFRHSRPRPRDTVRRDPGALQRNHRRLRGLGRAHDPHRRGRRPAAIRTGVTAILPSAELSPYEAATFVLNGDAELSGAIFAEEFDYLRSPIMLTGTASNGTVYTAVIKWSARKYPDRSPVHIPVVADTWDAYLSDYLAFPLTEEHVFAALDSAAGGPVAEGSVGGGTGMFCHDFKAGIGTSSRVLADEHGGYTVGVLVQANYGDRHELRIAGIPVGREIPDLLPELRESSEEPGEGERSILVVVATDAPVDSRILKAMAKRATLGLARNGATASPFSGDVVIAFANRDVEWLEGPVDRRRADTLNPYDAGPLFTATIHATEEAVINSLVAGRTMSGLHGSRVFGMPHGRVQAILRRHNRLEGS